MDTVRISTPEALLRLLPKLIGEPEPPSLVVLPFAGKRSLVPMVLDLPPRKARGGGAAIAASMPSADAAILVACLDRPIGAGRLPRATAMRRLARELERVGVRVREVLALAPDCWGDYARPEGARGPRAELDLLDDPAPHAAVPQAPPGVPVWAGPLASLGVRHWLDRLRRDDVRTAIDAPIEAIEAALDAAGRIHDGPSALGIHPARAVATALLLVQRPSARDIAIGLAADGPAVTAGTIAAEAAGDDEPVRRAAERLMGEGATPDIARLEAHLAGWTAIAERAPDDLRAPVLVIVGFLHFFLGRARTAGRCAEAAIELDGNLTMAPLLRQLVDLRGVPQWVRDDLAARDGGPAAVA